MNATISPASVRAAGLAKYLRLTLRQTARVAVVGFVPFGLAAVVTASHSGIVSYSELCSLLAWSMMLTGILFALVIGVRTFFVQESWQMFVSRGSSPLTRGKHCARRCRRLCPGLIPAHAGKTLPDLRFYRADRSDLGKP